MHLVSVALLRRPTDSTVRQTNSNPGQASSEKPASLQQVPDSEAEDNAGARARSPLAELAAKTLANASFYLRQPSREPEDASVEQPSANGKNDSYDYSAEEHDFQNQQQGGPRRKTVPRRGGGMSSDNKAYKPTQSDMEDSDEEFVDDDNRKRKTKKKDAGRVTTLPTISETKRRKKKSKPSKGTVAGEESEDGEEEEEEEQVRYSLCHRCVCYSKVTTSRPEPLKQENLPQHHVGLLPTIHNPQTFSLYPKALY